MDLYFGYWIELASDKVISGPKFFWQLVNVAKVQPNMGTVKPLTKGIMFTLANLSLLRKFLMWEMMMRVMKNSASKIINITTQDRKYKFVQTIFYKYICKLIQNLRFKRKFYVYVHM